MIDSIVLEPAHGEFDLDAIEDYLDRQHHAARDPQERRRFLLSDDPRALHAALAKRRKGAPEIPTNVIVLFPSTVRILLGVRTTETRPARAFVEWLRDRHELKILDNEFNDFTEKYRDNLDLLFGAES